MPKKSAGKSKSKQEPKAPKAPKPPKPQDPTTDEALLALPASYADAPDIPIAVAHRELASLARLASAQQSAFTKIGLPADKIASLAHFAKRLRSLEKAWQKSRAAVHLSSSQRKLLSEADDLDTKLLAGGRWACRMDKAAQEELSRIAEGSGLDDTIQDLRDLVTFWEAQSAHLGSTDITEADLARATHLADTLEEAAALEAADVQAARALELRNRGFWAADELAKEIREGGRYAFKGQPKTASKFVSRYRASANRRSRRKAKAETIPADGAARPAPADGA